MTRASFSILVVCTANICRSPAAQVLLTARLSGSDVQVESAGTRALDGNLADAAVVRLLSGRGFDAISLHRSRPIMPTMLGRYDLILCMQDEHVSEVLSLYPVGRGKVRLLGHWSEQQIADPIGESDTVYAATLDQIDACGAQWVQKLTDLGMMR